MPPKRSVSSRALGDSNSNSSDRPIQTTTNTLSKLEMSNAGDATEAKINVAGGNTKGAAVTLLHNNEPTTPEKSKRAASHGGFQPGTTSVKFGGSRSAAADAAPRPPVSLSEIHAVLLRMPNPAFSLYQKKGFSLRRLAVQLTLAYALVAYFLICPNAPSRAPAVCQSFKDLEAYRNQGISYIKPIYQPYFDQAVASAQPYYQPYLKASQPHVDRVQKIVQPQAVKARANFDKHVKPRLIDAVTRSRKQIMPHANRLSREYGRLTNPYVKRYSILVNEFYDLNVKPTYDELSKEARKVVLPLYHKSSAYVQPFVKKAYPATQHHLRHTVLPFAMSSYATSRRLYSDQVHPLVMSGGKGAIAFFRTNLVPALGRFRSRYISPQLDKIQDRAFAYKAKSVAREKVATMDADLGKDVIQDEIEGEVCWPKSAARTDSGVWQSCFRVSRRRPRLLRLPLLQRRLRSLVRLLSILSSLTRRTTSWLKKSCKTKLYSSSERKSGKLSKRSTICTRWKSTSSARRR